MQQFHHQDPPDSMEPDAPPMDPPATWRDWARASAIIALSGLAFAAIIAAATEILDALGM